MGALGAYPHCKGLILQFRTALNIPNKTPVSMLHEYATRLNLQVGSTRFSAVQCLLRALSAEERS